MKCTKSRIWTRVAVSNSCDDNHYTTGTSKWWCFLIWELIFIYCGLFGSFLVVFFCFFFHYVSAKFHLCPSSGDLPRPQIGMLSLVTVSPVITAFHSCCLSHHVFDQVNLWPAWVGFETAIFWQCSPGTVETLSTAPRAPKDGFFGLINPYLFFQSRVRTKFFCTCLWRRPGVKKTKKKKQKKNKTKTNYQDEDKKSAINKN